MGIVLINMALIGREEIPCCMKKNHTTKPSRMSYCARSFLSSGIKLCWSTISSHLSSMWASSGAARRWEFVLCWLWNRALLCKNTTGSHEDQIQKYGLTSSNPRVLTARLAPCSTSTCHMINQEVHHWSESGLFSPYPQKQNVMQILFPTFLMLHNLRPYWPRKGCRFPRPANSWRKKNYSLVRTVSRRNQPGQAPILPRTCLSALKKATYLCPSHPRQHLQPRAHWSYSI